MKKPSKDNLFFWFFTGLFLFCITMMIWSVAMMFRGGKQPETCEEVAVSDPRLHIDACTRGDFTCYRVKIGDTLVEYTCTSMPRATPSYKGTGPE